MSLLADFALIINVSRKSVVLIITPKFFFAAGRETTQRRNGQSIRKTVLLLKY
jgi:hypothetical protein